MIRFVASEWRKLSGQSMSPIIFLIARQHLEKTMAAPITKARKPLTCWACEYRIEIKDDYQTIAADRKLGLGAHPDCLRQTKNWADRQWRANTRRWKARAEKEGKNR